MVEVELWDGERFHTHSNRLGLHVGFDVVQLVAKDGDGRVEPLYGGVWTV